MIVSSYIILFFFFFQAEDGIRDLTVTGVQRVLFRSLARDAERDAGVADLGLGAHQPLRHRRLRHEERVRDLGGGQAAEQAQRQRHLGGRGERRVAAGEDQSQPVVAHGTLLDELVAGVQQRRLGVAVLAQGLATQAVDRPVAGSGDDPPRRAGRHAVGGPARARDHERVLDRLLGDVDVAEAADQDRHGSAVLLTEDPLDDHANGRTSTGSEVISAIRLAQRSAASRSGAATIVKPPRCSLPSRYGPSVISGSPPLTRTTVAVAAGCRPLENTHWPAALISSLSAPSSRPIRARSTSAGGSPSGW